MFYVLAVLKRRALPPRYRDARPNRLRYGLFTLPGTSAPGAPGASGRAELWRQHAG